MNREFYKKVKEELNNNKNICIVTVIKDKEDKHLGKKILKIDDEILFEDEENIEFYNKIINKINFNESGKTIKIDDDIEIIIENIISKPNLIICGGGTYSFIFSKYGKNARF